MNRVGRIPERDRLSISPLHAQDRAAGAAARARDGLTRGQERESGALHTGRAHVFLDAKSTGTEVSVKKN